MLILRCTKSISDRLLNCVIIYFNKRVKSPTDHGQRADSCLDVFYVGTNQHIYDHSYDSTYGWRDQDLTTITGGALVASGTSLTSDGGAAGNPVHLYYLGTNQHILPAKNGTRNLGWIILARGIYGSGLGRFITPDWSATPDHVPLWHHVLLITGDSSFSILHAEPPKGPGDYRIGRLYV